jgi:hypothetical protein
MTAEQMRIASSCVRDANICRRRLFEILYKREVNNDSFLITLVLHFTVITQHRRLLIPLHCRMHFVFYTKRSFRHSKM